MRALDQDQHDLPARGPGGARGPVDEDLRRAQEFADSMNVSYPIMFDAGLISVAIINWPRCP